MPFASIRRVYRLLQRPSSNVFPIQKRYGRHPTSTGAEPKALHTHSGDQHVWHHCPHCNRRKFQATLFHTLPKISAASANESLSWS
ncbi:hypothetical protein PGTUg99_022689 [Puccinia graminis f. sp. tritici]|uniref:Uncharacterized protein n=1 Tax=Puccinia graminis f. sp. tritici TaxID=56615 RepID=A0A5B0MST2_PUCGR|nr:hypothetical protein PGTUg99_022689 [Puccinia graminis f. sp. tritici]